MSSTFRSADIEVDVTDLARGRYARVVSVAGTIVFDLPGPAFPPTDVEAARSALMTLLHRLAADQPGFFELQARFAGRAEDLAEMRRVLERDPDSLRVD